MRGMLLNAIVWVPLSVLAMVLILSTAQWLGSDDHRVPSAESVIESIRAGTFTKGGVIQIAPLPFAQDWTLPEGKAGSAQDAVVITKYWGGTDAVRRGLRIPVMVLGTIFSIICVLYSLLTRVPREMWRRFSRWVARSICPRMVAAGWTAMKARFKVPRITTRYLARRVIENADGTDRLVDAAVRCARRSAMGS